MNPNIKKVNSKTEQFANLLSKCNTDEFIGICKILKVSISNGAITKEEFDLRPFEEVWAEVVEKFNDLGRAQRRELSKILKEAVAPNGSSKA